MVATSLLGSGHSAQFVEMVQVLPLVAGGLLAVIWVTAREQIAWCRQHSCPLATVQRNAAEPLATASKHADYA